MSWTHLKFPDHLVVQEERSSGGATVYTVIFEIITFLIRKHFKTVTVTVVWGKLIRKNFKMVIGNQWK